jgi:hypothetical protein
MQNSNTAKLSAARRVVRAELRSYDILSQKAKICYVKPESRHSIESRNVGPEKGYVCGHNVSLCSPCDKCARSQQDCIEYQVALAAKLKVLLSQLKQK